MYLASYARPALLWLLLAACFTACSAQSVFGTTATPAAQLVARRCTAGTESSAPLVCSLPPATTLTSGPPVWLNDGASIAGSVHIDVDTDKGAAWARAGVLKSSNVSVWDLARSSSGIFRLATGATLRISDVYLKSAAVSLDAEAGNLLQFLAFPTAAGNASDTSTSAAPADGARLELTDVVADIGCEMLYVHQSYACQRLVPSVDVKVRRLQEGLLCMGEGVGGALQQAGV